MESFNIAEGRQTPVNRYEIELHDILITRSITDTTFEVDMDTTLVFLQPFKLYFIELIDSEYPISREDLEEYLQEESRHCTLEKGGISDMKYKEDAANYWKRGKRKRLSVESVQRRFRKVNSQRQLYRWQESLEKGRTIYTTIF
ncbi:hypothetical protein Trydic_g1658 [Trypoxylus dichotomus]